MLIRLQCPTLNSVSTRCCSQSPPPSRKVSIPLSAEMPAPMRITIFRIVVIASTMTDGPHGANDGARPSPAKGWRISARWANCRKVQKGWGADVAYCRCFAHVRAMKRSVAIIFLGLAVPACGTGERPFRMVQFCLGDIGQIATMNAVLRNVAATNRLPFYDNSKATEARLRTH